MAAASAVIPDADRVLHATRGYTAFLSGDTAGCDRNRGADCRAEAAVIWLRAGRLDKSA